MKKLEMRYKPQFYVSTYQAKAMLPKNTSISSLQKYKKQGSRRTFYLKEDVELLAGVLKELAAQKNSAIKNEPTTNEESDKAPITETKEDNESFTIEAYVDGSFDKKTGIYGSAAILVSDGQILAKKSSNGTEMNSMWNVAGEIAAAAMAVSLAEELMPDHLIICYDCEAIEKWPTGQWSIKNEYARKYVNFMNKKRIFDIRYKHIKAHSGDKYNEMADDMAIEAAGITQNDPIKPFTGEYRALPVNVLRTDYQVKPACTMSITEFYAKEKHAFKDYLSLKVGESDAFSSMKNMDEFRNILSSDIIDYIEESLSDISDRLNACRWVARGLAPYDAAKKATVDREVFSKRP